MLHQRRVSCSVMTMNEFMNERDRLNTARALIERYKSGELTSEQFLDMHRALNVKARDDERRAVAHINNLIHNN